jgi:hypothetical protein
VAARIFLGLSALIWIGFGLYGFFQPGFFADAAGVTFTTPTGATDMRATYGGLATAIGALALTGLLRPDFTRHALLVLAAVGAGLGGARLIGVGLDGDLTAWTVQALVFELGTVALGAWLLRRA